MGVVDTKSEEKSEGGCAGAEGTVRLWVVAFGAGK